MQSKESIERDRQENINWILQRISEITMRLHNQRNTGCKHKHMVTTCLDCGKPATMLLKKVAKKKK